MWLLASYNVHVLGLQFQDLVLGRPIESLLIGSVLARLGRESKPDDYSSANESKRCLLAVIQTVQ